MPRSIRWIAPLAALACLFVPAAAADQWMKYESAYLTVYSDCPPYRAKSLIRQFAAHQHATRALLMPDKRNFPHTTLIYFHDETELRKYVWPTQQHNHFIRTLFGWNLIGREQLLATAWDGNIDQRLNTMRYRDADLLLNWYDDNVPRWLRFALISPMVSMGVSRDGVAYRSLSREYVSLLTKTKWLDWDAILANSFSDEEDDIPSVINTADSLRNAQLQLLGHWILFGAHDHPVNYGSMITALQQGHASKIEAFEAGLGMNCTQLDLKLRQHLETGLRAKPVAFAVADFELSLKMSPAPAHELHLLFYELLAFRKAANATQELHRAIDSGVDTIPLKLSRARQAFRENRTADAVKLCREAIAAGSRDPIAHLVSAEARLGQVTYNFDNQRQSSVVIHQVVGAAGPDFFLCLDEIRTALRLDPDFKAAYATLGRAFFAAPAVTRTDADELSPGVTVHPQGLYVRYLRGVAYERAGAFAEADADFSYLVEHHPTSVAARLVADWRGDTAYENTNRIIVGLMAEKRFFEARQLIDQALTTPAGKSRQREYQQLLLKVDEADSWNILLELFRETMWEELERQATHFIAHHPRSKHLPAVRNMLSQASRHLD